MSIICQAQVVGDIRYAIWAIEESLDDLVQQYLQYDSDLDFVYKYLPESRKKQTLAARLALCTLLNNESPKIIYKESGKPVLKTSAYHISLTHTKAMAAAVVSKQYHVGIDIEKCVDKILNLCSKFISQKEMSAIQYPTTEEIHLYWGAKEAMYKMIAFPDVNFKNNFQLLKNGIQGEIKYRQYHIPVQIFSKMIQKHLMVISYFEK